MPIQIKKNIDKSMYAEVCRCFVVGAPETEQPYGPQATEALRKLILGKKIEGEAVTRDIYGRIVCRVVCDKRDMSLTMIRQGYTWPYYQYFYRLSPKERAAYKKAALLAKTEGLGLWQEKNPTAPWQWRKDHRTVFTRLMYWLRRFVWWILRRYIRCVSFWPARPRSRHQHQPA